MVIGLRCKQLPNIAQFLGVWGFRYYVKCMEGFAENLVVKFENI
jgi:hypothetical protein